MLVQPFKGQWKEKKIQRDNPQYYENTHWNQWRSNWYVAFRRPELQEQMLFKYRFGAGWSRQQRVSHRALPSTYEEGIGSKWVDFPEVQKNKEKNESTYSVKLLKLSKIKRWKLLIRYVLPG